MTITYFIYIYTFSLVNTLRSSIHAAKKSVYFIINGYDSPSYYKLSPFSSSSNTIVYIIYSISSNDAGEP